MTDFTFKEKKNSFHFTPCIITSEIVFSVSTSEMLQLYKMNDEQNEMHTLCAWSNAAKTGNAYMNKNKEQTFAPFL